MHRDWTIPLLSHWRYLASAAVAVLVLVAAATLPVHTTAARDLSDTGIQASTDGISVAFAASSERDLLTLSVRVVGPDGSVFEQRTEGGLLNWIPEGNLADGKYAWEARAVTADPGAPLRALPPGTSTEVGIEHFIAPEHQQTHVASGSLLVEDALVESITSSETMLAEIAGMAVTATGVGIGTDTPATALHVQRSDNTAQARVTEAGASAVQQLFRLEKNGFPAFNFTDTAQSDVSWTFRLAGNEPNDRFEITKVGSGGSEFRVFANGDAELPNGVLIEASSRHIKDNIVELSADEVLEKLAGLPVHEWSYSNNLSSRHLSPMAEDFYAIFGLGRDDKGIAPKDLAGVALAAAKGLAERSAALKAETKALRAENAELRNQLERKTTELRDRLEQLEAMLIANK